MKKRKTLNKRIIILLGLCLFFSSIVFAGPNENAGIRFDLDATTYGNQNDTTMATPAVGDYIRVDVYAINVHNLDTYEFEVNYNPDQLDYITSTPTNPITYEPNILTTNGGTAVGWMIDTSTPGVLSIAYTLTGTDTLEAPEGEGLIADIVFHALTTEQDIPALTFGNVYFCDSFCVIDIITDKGVAILGIYGSVEGTVTDSDTNEPIEGAVVSYGDTSDTTGIDGTYLLEYIPIGRQEITCMAEGYYDTSDVVEVLEDQTITLDFILGPLPRGSIDGTVTDADTNEPIEGALITTTGQDKYEYTGSTNTDGYYIIENVVIGTYDVTCSAEGYYDGTDTAEVLADQTITINFALFYQESPTLTYAVVIKQSTYNNPDWQAVADALLARYQGQLFIWNYSLNEVQSVVATFHPTHIGFVCDLYTASPSFVQNSVWPFTRALDSDAYCDAVWGIITGYDAQDALNLVTGPTGFEIKTVLGGTSGCDLNYYTQGIATSECTYGQYSVKYPDSLETTPHTDGPTDRTEWLVTMINDGIDIFNYDPVDIFYTSGHGNYNNWQLHYPTSGSEGYFRSSYGQVYGDPYYGSNININSNHPKIYFGLGNCYIGKIINGSCMAPSWIHTGGAYQYTGYVIAEGSTSCQHGGTKAYFYKAARNNTWAESFMLANIALKFDMINGTP